MRVSAIHAAQVEVIDGVLRKGDRVTACSSGENYEILEVRPSCRTQVLHVESQWSLCL